MSIRAKLLVPLLLLAASVIVAMHFVAFAPLKRTLVAERMSGEQRALGMVALALAPDLLANDLAKIHETLDEVAGQYPWWHALSLTDAAGRRLYPLAALPDHAGLARLEAASVSLGKPLARLVVSVDQDAMVAPALEVVQRLELAVVLLLVVGTLAVMGLQSRQVVRPLNRLAEASHRISQGHYDVELPPPSRDEVGKLFEAFQTMRAAVGRREAELLHSQKSLAAVIDNSAEAVLSLSPEGLIMSFNKAAESMFGAEAAKVTGTDIRRLVPLDDPASAAGIEMEALRLDGSSFAAQVTAGRVEVDDRLMVVLTVIDLTQRKLAEASLKESEGRFRDLAESASDWFWETDTDYRLTFVSERIGNILGVKPTAILGFSYFDVGLGDADPELVKAHAEELEAHRPFRDLVFLIGPEGGKDGKIVRISGMPFHDERGDFIGYRGVGADITREARAEKLARQAQQQLADAIESITDAIALYDDHDRLVLCNGEYYRVFESLAGRLEPGSRFSDIFSDPRARELYDTGGMAYEDWVEMRLELHRKADGEPFLLHLLNGRWLLCREFRTADGGVVGVRTDITDLKRREQDLEALKHRYQLILGSAGDGIVGLDHDGRVTFANRMAATLLDRRAEDMVGQDFTALVEASESDRRALANACGTGMAEKVDDCLFHRPGLAPLPVEFLAASLVENDEVVGAVLVFRDVTMRRQYERALADQHAELERLVEERTEAMKQAQREALQASRMASVGQLAAGIAHEINTPIQYIGDNLNFLQSATAEMIPLLVEARKLAEELTDTPPARDFAERYDGAGLAFLMEETPPAVVQSLEGVAQVARIVLSMKEFSHPGTTQKSAVSINRALDSTLVVCRNTWKHVAQMETRFDPDLPLVNCHPGEMNQIFLNLVINAAHAIEASGKPLPGTIVVETATCGDWAEIRVSDSGTGVPEEIRDRIFDPFFTTKDVGKGTGQGLAICYDVVVTKHGGQITVGGTPGEGAIFTIRLPVAG